MFRDAARARIQQTLAFRSDKETEILAALQDAQVMLERGAELPWFLLSEVASITTTDGEERMALPTDFLREWEDDPLWYFVAGSGGDADTWTELAKDDLALLRSKYPGEGAPVAYALDVKYFRIFPTPDDTYTLKMMYFKADAVLTTNIENQWLTYFPHLVIGEAGLLLATGLRDKDAIAIFQKWIDEGRDRMIVENEARMHASHGYVMGGQN